MDSSGAVHEATNAGGSWKVADLGTSGAPNKGAQSDAGWGTGVAVDDQGTVRVAWANLMAEDIELSTSSGGQFQAQQVAGSAGGQMPALAATPDGRRVVVAWYASVDGDLAVAEPTSTIPPLAYSPVPVPSGSASSSPAGPGCEPQGTSADLSIESPSAAGFSVQCLAVAADTPFTVTLKNTDTSIIHNWALYQDQAAATAGGAAIGGATSAADVVQPGASATYKLDGLKAGSYFFHCDIHPDTMKGTLEVVGK